MRDIEEHIEIADRDMKQRADDTLRNIENNYRRLVSERMEHELDMVDKAHATGNGAVAEHHRVLAQVYGSMLAENKAYNDDA